MLGEKLNSLMTHVVLFDWATFKVKTYEITSPQWIWSHEIKKKNGINVVKEGWNNFDWMKHVCNSWRQKLLEQLQRDAEQSNEI